MNPTQKYRRTPKGVLTNMYNHMKLRHSVSFDLDTFHAMYLEDLAFKRLCFEWVKSGYKTEYKPSIDRINNKGNYSVDNIHILSWRENRFKQSMERRNRKGPVLQMLNGEVVARYRSQREAVKATGLNQGLMSEVLNGKRNHTGGYQWKYINPELLEDKP